MAADGRATRSIMPQALLDLRRWWRSCLGRAVDVDRERGKPRPGRDRGHGAARAGARVSRRFLLIAAALFGVLGAAGLLGVDRMLAQWVRASGLERADVFVVPLDLLDTISGLHTWYWLAGSITLALALAGLALMREARWPRVLALAALVQLATIASMMLGKSLFGRLRPEQVLASGDWSQTWFVGGGSFPSGHSSFYFGLLLPIAAACPAWWQRVALLGVPLFAIAARIDMARHFLSDVMASALLAALYALLLATLTQRWLPAPARRT